MLKWVNFFTLLSTLPKMPYLRHCSPLQKFDVLCHSCQIQLITANKLINAIGQTNGFLCDTSIKLIIYSDQGKETVIAK